MLPKIFTILWIFAAGLLAVAQTDERAAYFYNQAKESLKQPDQTLRLLSQYQNFRDFSQLENVDTIQRFPSIELPQFDAKPDETAHYMPLFSTLGTPWGGELTCARFHIVGKNLL